MVLARKANVAQIANFIANGNANVNIYINRTTVTGNK